VTTIKKAIQRLMARAKGGPAPVKEVICGQVLIRLHRCELLGQTYMDARVYNVEEGPRLLSGSSLSLTPDTWAALLQAVLEEND